MGENRLYGLLIYAGGRWYAVMAMYGKNKTVVRLNVTIHASYRYSHISFIQRLK